MIYFLLDGTALCWQPLTGTAPQTMGCNLDPLYSWDTIQSANRSITRNYPTTFNTEEQYRNIEHRKPSVSIKMVFLSKHPWLGRPDCGIEDTYL